MWRSNVVPRFKIDQTPNVIGSHPTSGYIQSGTRYSNLICCIRAIHNKERPLVSQITKHMLQQTTTNYQYVVKVSLVYILQSILIGTVCAANCVPDDK